MRRRVPMANATTLAAPGTRSLAMTLAATAILWACSGLSGTSSIAASASPVRDPTSTAPSPLATRDYCREGGFTDGAQRNDAGDLVAECKTEPTPNGGVYSIARYFDANGPADKEDATAAEITEYDTNGNVVHTTRGTVGGG